MHGIRANSGPLGIAATALLTASPAIARDLPLAQPIDCTLGETCYIQNLVDRDPSPAFADHTCGPLGYDGHKGTDFALPYLENMEAGVDVLAAAPGVVRGVRDELPDISIRDPDAPDTNGRDCGNGVVIDHGGGWETQYCHLKEGSVAVRLGQRVPTGRILGQVGLSGHTEFPHLHLSVRKDGRVVDPFAADDLGPSCGEPGTVLWTSDTPAPQGGLLDQGFFFRVPELEEIKARDIGLAEAPTDTPALVFWAYFFGGQKGDQIELIIEGPGGFESNATAELDRNQAIGFRAAGRRNSAGTLASGVYTGSTRMIRQGRVIAEGQDTIMLTSP